MSNSPQITPEYIRTRIWEIRQVIYDDEVAHSYEDSLREHVLTAIADGTCADPKGCAAEVLKTGDLDFARWYA